MYAVVGCNGCSNIWILENPREQASAQCSRCGKRHQTKKLRKMYTAEDHDAARQVRSAILAEKQGASEAFSTLDSVSEMETQLDDAHISDREYLERSGLDADEVAAAGDESSPSASSKSRRELVEDAVAEQDRPTEEEVVSYAAERGVPGEKARDILEKLARRGEVSESGGRYRSL
ncbi:DUF5817 domain-containing protein [Haloprofundus sp. MHR1]|uniref:DUF5817 domain-containing protein n=1 Tax=Haloprofundus sp. MHR1 TaxID=2572921 RepID=UPI0010BF3DBF|nr:DUF5817 domain-containing protein [Haloprofundus sp. MHR1]QCJ46107.1 replication protein H [Haloprofundus sp. MHR1]